MAHELILTSVSQGLEPNSSGYCIVAEDRHIPRYLAKRLETLSEYCHFFPSGSEEARFHPVVYSHLIFPGRDTIWHTLSRIADAGTDYRFQPNQLAHHIVLTENELVQEGPAWLLSLPEFHLTDWVTPSVRFTSGRPIPTLTLPPNLTRSQRIARERRWTDPRKMMLFVPDTEDWETYRIYENDALSNSSQHPCPFWQELVGDAGWAGILAETIQTGQQAVLLFQPGMNILPLFFEAIALLPAELHWKGTFSTYYFKDLPEHTACQWKAVLADSPMAERLLKNNDQLVLDLTKPLGMIPDGEYVEFARTGLVETLPKKEIPENPFHSQELTNKEISVPVEILFQPSDQSTAPDTPPMPFKTDELSKTDPNHSVAENSPPIIVQETIRIQTKTTKQQNLFHSILNMKSRGQFYFLYGITFLLLLVLLLLVFDQVTNFGVTRLFQKNDKTKPKTVAGSPVNPKKAKIKEDENIAKSKVDTAASEDKNKTKQKEEQEKQSEQAMINAAQTQKKQLQELANTIRSEIAEQKKRVQKNLDEYLSDHKLPKALSISVPKFQDDHVDPPELKMFPELIDLYPFGLAIELEYVPLLDIPKVRVETRKRTFFRELDENDLKNTGKEKTSQNSNSDTDSSLDQSTDLPTDSLVDDSTDSLAESSVTGLRVPVTDRFEWSVMAVDTDTLQETPMFDLKLTEEGLSLDWRIEGMDAQHLYETLAASFGFLRVFTENNHDQTKIQSIPLFDPKIQKPLFLKEHFIDPKIQEYSVEMPFASEPWRSFFGTTKIPFAFRLDVTVKPEISLTTQNEGVKEIKVHESSLPSEFLVEFQTDVESKKDVELNKTVIAGSETYSPVTISFEGAAEPERIVWYDRSERQKEILKQEQETANITLATIKKERDVIQKEFLIDGRTTTPEQRKKRDELSSEKMQLESRNKEIADILSKIPAAREKIVKNEQLRFDYSVYLIPLRDKITKTSDTAENATEKTENQTDRLRKEESLLIMKTEMPE
ncbi:MAG: hypothetical protein LBC02_08230 [Planctomycetaceae bacterium]|jgi:hypothetical protein|nr:hypothetical protein [Planctomycetaceae bacterium]